MSKKKFATIKLSISMMPEFRRADTRVSGAPRPRKQVTHITFFLYTSLSLYDRERSYWKVLFDPQKILEHTGEVTNLFVPMKRL